MVPQAYTNSCWTSCPWSQISNRGSLRIERTSCRSISDKLLVGTEFTGPHTPYVLPVPIVMAIYSICQRFMSEQWSVHDGLWEFLGLGIGNL